MNKEEFDRRNSKLSNGIVFRKSDTACPVVIEEIQQVYEKTQDKAIILDINGKYTESPCCFIKDIRPFDLNSAYRINPLDIYLYSGYNKDRVCENVCRMCATLITVILRRSLGTMALSNVNTACRKVMIPFIEKLEANQKKADYANNPTLEDVVNEIIFQEIPNVSEVRLIRALKKAIKDNRDEDNSHLADRLERDTIWNESLYCHNNSFYDELKSKLSYIHLMFSYHTNMPDNRVIQLSWYDVPLDMEQAAYLACIPYVANTILQNYDCGAEGKQVWFYMENIDANTFDDRCKDNLYEIVAELYKHCYSHRGIGTLLLQSYQEIRDDGTGRVRAKRNEYNYTFRVNAGYKWFFALSDTEKIVMKDDYDLSDEQIGYISQDGKKGLFCRSDNFIFSNERVWSQVEY